MDSKKSVEFMEYADQTRNNDGQVENSDWNLSKQEDQEKVDGEHNDEDDNNDDSSVYSMSSEESLTLLEKVERNREKNELYLSELNEKYKDDTSPFSTEQSGNLKTDARLGTSSLRVEESKQRQFRQQGILLKSVRPVFDTFINDDDSALDIRECIQKLEKTYPQRETQIRQLVALFHATISQASSSSNSTDTQVYSPAPIFAVGPRGTGKTSILCDVLECIQKCHASQPAATTTTTTTTSSSSSPACSVGNAYINCSTLEPYTIERLVSSAYQQLRPPEYARYKRLRRTMRLEERQRKMKQRKLEADKNKNDDPTDDNETLPTSGREPLPEKPPKRRGRPRKNASINNGNSMMRGAQGFPNNTETVQDAVETSQHSSVVALGRSLRPFYGPGNKRAAFLILDNADRLMSLYSGKAQSKAKTNFLAELLLLPKIIQLNLTIIFLSNYSILESSRLNNIVAAGKTQSIISNSLHPIRVQFPAYKDVDSFRMILKTEHNLDLIVGRNVRLSMAQQSSLLNRLMMDEFLNIIIQLSLESTRDIRDMIRLCRLYWPWYIQPLDRTNILSTKMMILQLQKEKQKQKIHDDDDDDDDTTRNGNNNNNNDDNDNRPLWNDIVKYLSKKFYSFIKDKKVVELLVNPQEREQQRRQQEEEEPSDPTSTVKKNHQSGQNKPSTTTSTTQLPYLRTCLLLSAFICQTNRPDDDKKVFNSTNTTTSDKKRGRPRSSTATSMPTTRKDSALSDANQNRNIAFASSVEEMSQLRSLRLRPFPMERMLSIFVTLVKLNAHDTHCRKPARYDDVSALGSDRLREDFSQLVEMGFLHRAVPAAGSVEKQDEIDLEHSKFRCTLTMEEAIRLADDYSIPLNNYLVW